MAFKDLLSIFWAFFKIGAVTFGGGYSMLPILEHELERKRGWFTKQDLLDYFAIAQMLPGIIAVNTATLVGNKRRGVAGGAAGALGVVAPSIIIICVIAAFISNFTQYPVVQKVLFGMNIGVAAVLVQSVVGMVKKAIVDPVTLLLAVGAFVSVAFFSLHNVIILAVGIAAGLLLKWPRGPLYGAGKRLGWPHRKAAKALPPGASDGQAPQARSSGGEGEVK